MIAPGRPAPIGSSGQGHDRLLLQRVQRPSASVRRCEGHSSAANEPDLRRPRRQPRVRPVRPQHQEHHGKIIASANRHTRPRRRELLSAIAAISAEVPRRRRPPASLSSEGFLPHCVSNLTQLAGRTADPWIAPMVAGVDHASKRSIACESGSPQRRGPAHGRRGGAPGHEVRVPPPRKPPVENGIPGASKALVTVGVALQAALLILPTPALREGLHRGLARLLIAVCPAVVWRASARWPTQEE
jgi:hypothetical protein